MDVINVSKKPMEQIFYSLDGDSPKEFGDMNVNIRDDHNNVLEILSVNVNKPYHKEFNVQLNRPIKPKQKKTIIMEYDWEEPERTFFYRFASGCKHFIFSLAAKREEELDMKILKVDTETGSKIDDAKPPIITKADDKTVITWEKNDITIDEAYQFNW